MFLNVVRLSFLLVSSLFLLESCGNPKNANADVQEGDDELVIELDSDFVEFYNLFHEDSLFQLDHVAFPLDNNHELSIDGPWTPENWVMHKPFQDHDGSFVRNYDVMGKIVIEKIQDVNGFFHLERRFGKLSSGWNLIFYDITTAELTKPQE